MPSSEHQTLKTGSCRIISGKWRGRKINFDDAEGLRPTTDRIRETVFNWLQVYLPKSHCLDCFAGSGVLGFEALSRGADEVVFIDKNKNTVANLKKNAQMLKADNAVVVHENALDLLGSKAGSNLLLGKKFDLIFLDPPFHADILRNTSDLLNSSGCLAENALIYVEHAVSDKVVLPENWTCQKEKHSGQVTYKLFEFSS